MTTDAPPPTRRVVRAESTGSVAVTGEPPPADTAPDADGTLVVQHPADAPVELAGPVALAWVDETRISVPAADVSSDPREPDADLLAGVRRRSPWRSGVLVPSGLLLGAIALYAALTLLWPLHAIPPRIEAATVQTIPAPAGAPAWPAEGSAAVSVAGVTGSLASSPDAVPIASITKLVTALLVLDAQPLEVGQTGPEYRFTAADRARYWQYRADGESSLDVPVGGTLTEYQLLEGMLVGSANNYADRLVGNVWPSDAVYAQAARAWLSSHSLPGISIVDPSGISPGNTATPDALLALAARAMASPVIAEIVGKQTIDLPGAGTVTNTNPLMVDPGVVGIKTGTLARSNLLAAKDVAIGDTTVRLYAATLDQPNSETRDAATRALFAQLESELQLRPSVTAGTVAGQVVTRWGESVEVVTTADASVILWNGGTATPASEFDLGDRTAEGDIVGTLAVTGPLDSTSVDLELADDLEGPSPWWRLTHPLDVLGLNG